jgi:hypothetical protein
MQQQPDFSAFICGSKIYIFRVLCRLECGLDFKVNMSSQAQDYTFCMALCWLCGEKFICHTVSGKEKQCEPKKKPPSIAVLWKS